MLKKEPYNGTRDSVSQVDSVTSHSTGVLDSTAIRIVTVNSHALTRVAVDIAFVDRSSSGDVTVHDLTN